MRAVAFDVKNGNRMMNKDGGFGGKTAARTSAFSGKNGGHDSVNAYVAAKDSHVGSAVPKPKHEGVDAKAGWKGMLRSFDSIYPIDESRVMY